MFSVCTPSKAHFQRSVTQLSLGYRNHWTKFILNMAFYWLLGFYLPSSLSTAAHTVDILGSPGRCLKSVWDPFWAHALWDNASECILSQHCQPLALKADSSAMADALLQRQSLAKCLCHPAYCHTERKWCFSLCYALLRGGLILQELFGLCGGAEFGDSAFLVLFILLFRASIQHQDNWARVASNNSLCTEPRVITPSDP